MDQSHSQPSLGSSRNAREERCVTNLKTAAKETKNGLELLKIQMVKENIRHRTLILVVIKKCVRAKLSASSGLK